MPVPKKVREQANQAEQQLNELYGTDTGEQPAQAEQDEPEQDEPARADGADADAESASDDHQQQSEQPQPQQAESDTEGEPEPSYERLKAAHESLLGKYNAEVPRMAGEIRDLKSQIEQRDTKIRDLETQLQSAPQGEQRAEDNMDGDEYYQSLRDELGEEFANAVKKMAEKVAQGEVQSYQQQAQQTEEQRFWSNVYRNVPDFDTVNVDPKFVDWLKREYDIRTGKPLQEVINEAGQQLDAATVVRIFDEFKRAQQPQPARENDPASPQAQEAPKRKGQPAREPAQSQRSFTPQDYAQLQDEILKGRWKGREAEARQLEAEIHAAITQ